MQEALQKALNQFGTELVQTMIRELISAGKDNSGRLIRSLRQEVKPLGEQLELLIYGENYATFVDKGRRPGSFPPIQPLREWAKQQGIPDKAVYPIANKIYKYGIKPTSFINAAIKKTLEQNKDKIAKEVEQYIVNLLKKEK